MEERETGRADGSGSGALIAPPKLSTKIICHCLNCEREFSIWPSVLVRKGAGKYCSKKCHYEARRRASSTAGFRCRYCGSFVRARWKSDRRKYCGRLCFKNSRRVGPQRAKAEEEGPDIHAILWDRDNRDLMVGLEESVDQALDDSIDDFSFIEDSMSDLMNPEFSTNQELECFYVRLGMGSQFNYINGRGFGDFNLVGGDEIDELPGEWMHSTADLYSRGRLYLPWPEGKLVDYPRPAKKHADPVNAYFRKDHLPVEDVEAPAWPMCELDWLGNVIDKFLFRHIGHLNIPRRGINALREAGIFAVGQLVMIRKKHLLMLNDIGTGIVNQVLDAFARMGIYPDCLFDDERYDGPKVSPRHAVHESKIMFAVDDSGSVCLGEARHHCFEPAPELPEPLRGSRIRRRDLARPAVPDPAPAPPPAPPLPGFDGINGQDELVDYLTGRLRDDGIEAPSIDGDWWRETIDLSLRRFGRGKPRYESMARMRYGIGQNGGRLCSLREVGEAHGVSACRARECVVRARFQIYRDVVRRMGKMMPREDRRRRPRTRGIEDMIWHIKEQAMRHGMEIAARHEGWWDKSIDQALRNLFERGGDTPAMVAVTKMRYGLFYGMIEGDKTHTFREIGGAYGVSTERVRQMVTRAEVLIAREIFERGNEEGNAGSDHKV